MNKKKFSKIRELNRKKNYYLKSLRLRLACLIYDQRHRKPFDIKNINKILILRHDGKIGDTIVSTSLFREFKKKGYQVDVLVDKKNHCVVQYCSHITNLWIYDNNSFKVKELINNLASQHYDAVIDMGDKITPNDLRFLKKIKSKNIIGFNKHNIKLYNHSIKYDLWDTHISARYASLMNLMNISDFSTEYEIHIPQAIRENVNDFLKKLTGDMIIIINPFTADRKRDLSQVQVKNILDGINSNWPRADVIMIGNKSRLEDYYSYGVIKNPFEDFLSAAEIVRNADLVITPDTAIVHLAAIWKKPMVCLYSNDIHGMLINNDVWGPGYDEAIQLKTKNINYNISTISSLEIITAAKKILDN